MSKVSRESRETRGDSKEAVSSVRITDPYVIKLVTDEQQRSGEATAAGTAARLIIERLVHKEILPSASAV